MSQPAERYTTNILLDALSGDDLALLKPHLRREQLHREQVLVALGKPCLLYTSPSPRD